MDMFPYPSGSGPARRPPAGLHRLGHLLALQAAQGIRTSSTRWVTTPSAFPAEQYADADGAASAPSRPSRTSPATRRTAGPASGSALRLGPSWLRHRATPATCKLDAVGRSPAMLRRHWYDRSEQPGAPRPAPGADRRVRYERAPRGSDAACTTAMHSTGRRMARPGAELGEAEQADVLRRLPPRPSAPSHPGQLVPEAWGPCSPTRRSPPKAVRTRQLPGVPARAAPVVHAHHRIRPPSDRRP